MERVEILLPDHLLLRDEEELPSPELLDHWETDRRKIDELAIRADGIMFSYLYPERGVVIVCGTESGVRRLRGLVSVYWNHAQRLKVMEQRTAQHTNEIQEIERAQRQLEQLHVLSFPIPQKYLELVARHARLAQLQQSIPDIYDIRVENRIMTVRAFSEQAAGRARRILEVVELRYPIPKGHVGRIVGPEFTNLRQIQSHSGESLIRDNADAETNKRKKQGRGGGMRMRRKGTSHVCSISMSHHHHHLLRRRILLFCTGAFDIIVDDDYSKVKEKKEEAAAGLQEEGGKPRRQYREKFWEEDGETVDLVIYGRVEEAQDALLMLEVGFLFLISVDGLLAASSCQSIPPPYPSSHAFIFHWFRSNTWSS